MKRLLTLLILTLGVFSVHAQCWQTVAGGISHTIAVRPDGTLWAWGFNGSGQLGDGTLQNKGIPVQVGTDTDWKSVSASGNQSFALKFDGTLWAWGDNLWGQLGVGSYGDVRTSPTKVGTSSDWKSVSAGRTFSLAIRDDGSLWAWGENIFGQLGIQGAAHVPQKIGVETDWQTVAAGANHTLAIKNDGSLWAWGFNSSGELGDGTTTRRDSPVKIGTDADWKHITAGYDHSLAIKTNGTLWSWGNNAMGQTGDGTFVNKYVPTAIAAGSQWTSVSSGMRNSLAIRSDGTMWAWGRIIGTSGFVKENYRGNPTQLGTDSDWQWNASGETHSFAFKTDATLWVWGNNDWAEIGDNTFSDYTAPQLISTPKPSGQVVQAFCAPAAVADLAAAGTDIKWYASPSGGTPLPGDATLVNGNHYYATQTLASCESEQRMDVTVVVNLTPTPAPTGAASQTFCGSTTVGDLIATGMDVKWYSFPAGGAPLQPSAALENGGLYYASQTLNYCESSERLTVTFTLKATPPSEIPSPLTVCEGRPIGYLYANTNWYSTTTSNTKLPVDTELIDGAIYYASNLDACGESASRKPILIVINDTPPPLSLTDETWLSIAAGPDNSVAVRSDGTLWIWGDEYVGPTKPTYRYTPRQTGTDNSWRSITHGGYKAAGIQADGEIFRWDNNQLPAIQIGTDKDWVTITTHGYGSDYHSGAIKADGSLWMWGENYDGQLGDGTFVSKTVPSRVGTATDWKSVSNGEGFTLAIKKDGTLWAWGNNDYGQLGDGTTTRKNIPTRIGSGTDWKFIATSGRNSMGIRTDGSLWAWGDNVYGKLGDGTTELRRTPTKIGTSRWKTVAPGNMHTLAIREDGTLWAWGNGAFGSLGINQFSLRSTSTPKQVGSASNWKSVATGGSHSMALTNEGIMWLWGTNSSGELGLYELVGQRNIPVQLPSKQFSCGGPTSTLAGLSVQGNDIKWYATYNSPYTQNASGSMLSSGVHFYATQTINGMESCTRLHVVGDSGYPLSPLGNREQVFCSDAKVGDLTPSGPAINWYAYASGGVPLDRSTSLEDGKEYFAAQGSGSCESPLRLRVVARLTEPTPPEGEGAQTLCAGATVTNLALSESGVAWYDTEQGGSPLSADTELIHGQIYYASQSLGTCESTTRWGVLVELTSVLTPSGEALQKLCKGATVTDLEPSGPEIIWYETASGGAPLPAGTILVNGTEYFASRILDGCQSADRLRVAVEIYESLPLTGDAMQSFCSGAAVEDLKPSGPEIAWFETASGGTALETTTLLVHGDEYFAARIADVCGTADRLRVAVGIVNAAAPAGASHQTFCSGATVQDLEPSGATISWFESSVDDSPLQDQTPLIHGMHYYASETDESCESAERLRVLVELTVTPPPIGERFQTFSDGMTVADLFATGSNIKWYGSLEDALTGANSLASSQLLTHGTTYYATQTISGCESTTALAVDVGIATGVESAEAGLGIYPNPVDDVLVIRHTHVIDQITIVNVLGQNVFSKPSDDRSVEVDFSKMDKGVYQVQVSAEGRVILMRVVRR